MSLNKWLSEQWIEKKNKIRGYVGFVLRVYVWRGLRFTSLLDSVIFVQFL